jgi:Fur family peroxide stress response transcriptional regulator
MKASALIAQLRDNGYKVTPQRLAVCEIILSSKRHPTAEEVYQAVKKKHPTVSLATVYQALHLLTKLGLVQELALSDGVSRYEPNVSPHINVICPKCGEIRDFKPKSIEELWSRIVSELGFDPLGQRLDVYRYCDRCRSKALHRVAKR